jgi:hypothetical protein
MDMRIVSGELGRAAKTVRTFGKPFDSYYPSNSGGNHRNSAHVQLEVEQ